MRLFFVIPFVLLSNMLYAQDAVFQWAKKLNGTNVSNSNSIVVDSIGNIYTTGYFRGTTDFDPGPSVFNLTPLGGDDIFVLKLDVLGNFLWAKNFEGLGYEMGLDIAVDNQGNVYTTGLFQDTVDFDPSGLTYNLSSSGITDIFISKLDSNGVFVWAKKIGGIYSDEGISLAVDTAGNVYSTGFFEGTVDFDPGPSFNNFSSYSFSLDVFVLHLDTNGDFIWARQMGGIGDDYGEGIALDIYGNVFTNGSFESAADFDPGPSVYNLSSAGVSDVFVSRLDNSGLFDWAQRIGGSSSDYSNSIKLDALGNIYVTGSYNSACDFDPGPSFYFLVSNGLRDFYVFKLNVAGSFVWAKSIGGTGDDYSLSIAIDKYYNSYTTGFYSGTVDFDPNAGVFSSTSLGVSDIYINKLDASGGFVWSKSITSTGDARGYSITCDSSNNIYTTGFFYGTADFDTGSGTVSSSSTGTADAFILKMKNLNVTVNELEYPFFLNIYPNPSQGVFFIDANFEYTKFELVNILGEVIYFSNGYTSELSVDISYLPDGIYFVKLMSEKGIVTQKVCLAK